MPYALNFELAIPISFPEESCELSVARGTVKRLYPAIGSPVFMF